MGEALRNRPPRHRVGGGNFSRASARLQDPVARCPPCRQPASLVRLREREDLLLLQSRYRALSRRCPAAGSCRRGLSRHPGEVLVLGSRRFLGPAFHRARGEAVGPRVERVCLQRFLPGRAPGDLQRVSRRGCIAGGGGTRPRLSRSRHARPRDARRRAVAADIRSLEIIETRGGVLVPHPARDGGP